MLNTFRKIFAGIMIAFDLLLLAFAVGELFSYGDFGFDLFLAVAFALAALLHVDYIAHVSDRENQYKRTKRSAKAAATRENNRVYGEQLLDQQMAAEIRKDVEAKDMSPEELSPEELAELLQSKEENQTYSQKG